MMDKRLNNYLMIGLVIFIVILDWTTKWMVKTNMSLGVPIPIIGDFFQLNYIENPGMAFGITMNPVLFTLLSIVAAIVVFYYLYKLRNESWILQIALVCITAGAIGNLTERFLYGRVIDFLDFEFFDIIIPRFTFLGMSFNGYDLTRWPVFNVADMAVSCGMIIMIGYMIFVGDPLKALPDKKTEESLSNKPINEPENG
jgi:signal peptidase II